MASCPIARLRIVAVSATIPNVADVAAWLGVPRNGVHVFGGLLTLTPGDAVCWVIFGSQFLKYGRGKIAGLSLCACSAGTCLPPPSPAGEETRPVRLTTRVLGYAPARNDYMFERRLLDYLYNVVVEAGNGRQAPLEIRAAYA